MTELDYGGTKVTTIGVIVRDLQRAVEEYRSAFGWGPWKIIEHQPWDTTYRGRLAKFTMAEAYTRPAGEIGFALVEPGEGESLFHELLETRGEGLGFLTMWRPSHEEANAVIESAGREILMAGRVGESIRFYFLDTSPVLHVVFETGSGDTSTLNVKQIVNAPS